MIDFGDLVTRRPWDGAQQCQWYAWHLLSARSLPPQIPELVVSRVAATSEIRNRTREDQRRTRKKIIKSRCHGSVCARFQRALFLYPECFRCLQTKRQTKFLYPVEPAQYWSQAPRIRRATYTIPEYDDNFGERWREDGGKRLRDLRGEIQRGVEG